VTGDRPRPRRRDWLIAAWTVAAAVLFATGVGRVPHTPLGSLVYDVVLFNVVPLGAAALCFRAGRRVPAERVAWWAIGAGWASSIVANLLLLLVPAPADSFPSLPDLAYLAAYPLIVLHLLSLVHVRVPRFRPSTWLDGAIGALGVTACVTTFALAPSLDMAGLEANAATLTYPVADVLLLALVAAVIAVRGLHHDRTMLLVSLAFVFKLIGDLLLTRAQAQGGYVIGGPTDLTWVAAALLTGLAAVLARTRRDDDDPSRDPGARTGWRTLALPLTCNLASLVVLGLEWGGPAVSVGEICALGCLLATLVRTAVTFQEVRSLHEMRRQAATDDLTGLPNRRALLLRIGQQLRTGRPAALLLLDLDGFKAVNDSLGHAAGDVLLVEVARRLTGLVRQSDTVARLGGDEFVVLLDGFATRDGHERVRDAITAAITEPFVIDGCPVEVGLSIGVALSTDGSADPDHLLREADAAMYREKSTARRR
jgi:diguanylate cyclase (GGDEF)-like protein